MGGVSRITAQTIWVAGAIGLTMMCLLWTYCPAIFVAMGGKPAVVAQAVPYLRGRCIASPAIRAFSVLSGTFRGFKDTM
jgi:Na+-driven multidrug efflux pump